MKTNLIKLLAAVTACFAASGASAGAVVGATEFTQIANNIELVASYSKQAASYVTQIQQYETMLLNLEHATPSSLLGQAAGALWNDQNMSQTFANLQTIVVNGERMNYTLQNQDQMFKSLHPGYGSAFDFKNGYKNLSDNLLGTIQNALASAGAQADKFSSEQGMVQELQKNSDSANGQLQILHAANDIGVATISQLQQMRELSIAQMTAQSHYMGNQQDRTDLKDQANQDYHTGMYRTHVRTLQEIQSGVQ